MIGITPEINITNSTLYNTEHLGDFIALLPFYLPDGISNHIILPSAIDGMKVTVKYCVKRRGASLREGLPYGKAHLNYPEMTIYMPHPSVSWNKPLLAQLIYHEVLHTVGLDHPDMNMIQHLKTGYDQFFWANELPLHYGRPPNQRDIYDIVGLLDDPTDHTTLSLDSMMLSSILFIANKINHRCDVFNCTTFIRQGTTTLQNARWTTASTDEAISFQSVYQMYHFFLTKVYNSTSEEGEL